MQEVVAQAVILLTYYAFEAWLRLQGYELIDKRRIRNEVRALIDVDRGPLLICANHLTLIDSLFIQWALAPGWRLFFRRDLFAWNLPDKHNISKRWWVRTLCYLGKCIPVHRQGPPEEVRQMLDKVVLLLRENQSVVIFPEGGRSRIGRVDTEDFAYGVGKMLQAVPGTRVLCVFLRGLGQKEYGRYPARGERFFVRLRRMAPQTTFTGMRGDRDLATQIVRTLAEMETEYFEVTGLDR